MDELDCNKITKFVLPAIRISMAEEMNAKYNLNQSEIAHRLGIAQVAVSKYLNGRYSLRVKKIRDMINKRGLIEEAAMRAALFLEFFASSTLLHTVDTIPSYLFSATLVAIGLSDTSMA